MTHSMTGPLAGTTSLVERKICSQPSIIYYHFLTKQIQIWSAKWKPLSKKNVCKMIPEHWTLIPVGIWQMLTACSVMCPRFSSPLCKIEEISRSSLSMWSSGALSRKRGITSTTAKLVWKPLYQYECQTCMKIEQIYALISKHNQPFYTRDHLSRQDHT